MGLNKGAAVPTRVDDKPTLASQGIDKNLAHQARLRGGLFVSASIVPLGPIAPYEATLGSRESSPARADIRSSLMLASAL
jgi:hypothetical protein